MPALASLQQRSTIVTKSMSVDEGDPELDYQPAMNQFSEEDNILHLDLTQWDRIVEESYKQAVVVDIWAPWCKSCGKAADHFYTAADLNRDKPITFVKFNVEKNKEIC